MKLQTKGILFQNSLLVDIILAAVLSANQNPAEKIAVSYSGFNRDSCQ